MPLKVIANASILLGENLDFIDRGFIEIENGIIKKAASGRFDIEKKNSKMTIMDAEDLLVLPGFINAHTHIADSIAKDIGISSGIDARIHPVFGIKKKILERSRPEHLKLFIKSSAITMLRKGIVAFADFREGGLEGIELLKDAILGLPIKCTRLGRVDQYLSAVRSGALPTTIMRYAAAIFAAGDGLGISGANENTDESLMQYRKLRDIEKNKKNGRKKLIAIHAAESIATFKFSKFHTGKSEVERILLRLHPDFLVHMTNATERDILLAAERRIGIVVCPRANGVLGTGIPKVAKMLRSGCTVAIGTDNVMLNSPDIFRELDYLWKVSMAIEGKFIDPKELLKMPTVNAAKILHMNSGCIESGRAADLIFIDKNHIDLYPMHNPYASIVHRANEDSIKGLMIDGKFVSMTN